jgi:hypothetical protein
LTKFKKEVVVKQLKEIGIMVNTRITHTYYKEKRTLLDHKFASGLITKTQWTQYVTMLKRWTTITRKEYNVKIETLKEKEKTGEITKADVAIEVKKLKKVVKPEVKITVE